MVEELGMYTLWYRPRSGAKWVLVATATTRDAATALIVCGNRRGGDWYVGEPGMRP